jgi:peptide/nickel transport system permease protein
VGNPSRWCTFSPDILPTLMVPATLPIAVAIIAEAALSFLGLEQQPPSPCWGSMLNVAQRFLTKRALEGDMAGICNFSRGASRGDGLRDALDPRQW